MQLDTFLIGFISGDKYLGYYSVANKLLRYSITFITIIGTVLIPRLSYLWENDKVKYYEFLNISLKILLLISIPCSFFFLIFANNIINFFGGPDFQPAILTLKLLSPLCVIVSIAYFVGNLILFPQGKEKLYTIAVSISALFSVCINWIVIQYFNQNGAAVVQAVSETLAIVLMIYFTRKELKINIFDKSFLITLMMIFVISILFMTLKYYLNFDSVIMFIIQTCIYCLIIFGIILIKKDSTLILLINMIKNKFIKV